MDTLKKILLICSLATSATSHADTLGLTVGADFWQVNPDFSVGDTGATTSLNPSDQNVVKVYGRFEHPVPFMPNLAVSYQNLSLDASTTLTSAWKFGGQTFAASSTVDTLTSVKQADVTAYYELLDNDIVNLDMGITARILRSKTTATSTAVSSAADFSLPLPMLYARSDIAILGTKTHLFAEGNYTTFSSNRWFDLRTGIMYDLIDLPVVTGSIAIGMQVSDGQIYAEDRLDADYNLDGLFAGIQFHF